VSQNQQGLEEANLRIVLDLMGGDHAPLAPADGAAEALAAEPRLEMVLVGGPGALRAAESRLGAYRARVEYVESTQSIDNDENPSMAVRRKKDSSLVVGMRLAAERRSALVSCGPTGALMAAGLFAFGRIPGVRRPALGSPFPNLAQPGRAWFMLDIGANVEATAKDLYTYAVIGSLYSEMVLGVKAPRVGLLNVGTEPQKGNEVTRQAYQLLAQADLNFAGNVEAREIFGGSVDVVVCDGFVGNVLLKGLEGLAGSIGDVVRAELGTDSRSRAGAFLARPYLRRALGRLDYSEYGGAPLLGLAGACIKCHGSSGARAVSKGIALASQFVSQEVLEAITKSLAAQPPDSDEQTK